MKVNKKEYVGFHMSLQYHEQELKQFLNQKGAINKEELARLFSTKEQGVNPAHMEILFRLLDTDSNPYYT